MRKLLPALFGTTATLALMTTSPSPAAAGGWAVVSYDALPRLAAGEPATVTFQVLQHGVHPIDIEAWDGDTLVLRVTGPEGPVDVPAVSTTGEGRFAASFSVPADDEIGLQVVWDDGLVLQDAVIEVPVLEPATSPTWPGSASTAFAAVAVAGTALVAGDVIVRRRARAAARTAGGDLVSA